MPGSGKPLSIQEHFGDIEEAIHPAYRKSTFKKLDISAVSLAKRLGYNRCWNASLPGKDVNEFFLRHTREEFDHLLQDASQFSLPGVIDVRAVLELLQGEESREGWAQGSPVWNYVGEWRQVWISFLNLELL